MDSKRLTDEQVRRMKWCAEKQMEKLWDLREELSSALGELLLLRADAAELAGVMNDSAYADCDCDEPHCMKARELLARPSVVNLLKEKDQ